MATDIAVDDQTKFAKPWTDVMSHEIYFEIRSHSDDGYSDLQELPVKQRPTLNKRQARQAWKCERDMAFYNALMRESTSYRSYAIDDMNSKTAQRKIDDWYERIQEDTREREQTIRRMQDSIERHIQTMESACSEHTKQAERRSTES